jgi:hypothetical protein
MSYLPKLQFTCTTYDIFRRRQKHTCALTSPMVQRSTSESQFATTTSDPNFSRKHPQNTHLYPTENLTHPARNKRAERFRSHTRSETLPVQSYFWSSLGSETTLGLLPPLCYNSTILLESSISQRYRGYLMRERFRTL